MFFGNSPSKLYFRIAISVVVLAGGFVVGHGLKIVGLGLAAWTVWSIVSGQRRGGPQSSAVRATGTKLTMTAIVAEKMSKRFGQFTAVDDVSFEAPMARCWRCSGPTARARRPRWRCWRGPWSRTVARSACSGPTPGRAGRAWRARIGLVLQSTSLDAEVTVRDPLAQFARLYPNPWPVATALEMVDLLDDADAKVGVLSGGQRRRTDLAVGIIGRPEVLFLDEPTTALDPEARRRTWAAIENLTRTGTTVLLTTHYIDEADHLADRVIILAGGRIVSDTTPGQLRARSGT